MSDQIPDFQKSLDEQKSNISNLKKYLMKLEEKIISVLYLYHVFQIMVVVIVIFIVLYLVFMR